ncbi:hypothetical protein [Leptolyngbya sp. FACHB-261]|uniref:hypothetical protein n=1 Tax=Leptolyngbya sp. FACHB-261 TaxID=2692806 RepID=UPI0016875CE3|nr:hypothetical protein [Leptolyngbya sp. FACHB-261]MBD2100637.1 hypothetical protein [Leptolyngbya sp. FACHB-261]
MIGTVERLQKDIAQLQTEILSVASEIQETSGSYITVLAETVAKQALLSTYQLCTRAFPSRFLALSVYERQQLQQDLRKLITERQRQMPEELIQAMQAASLELNGFQEELDTIIARELKSLGDAISERLHEVSVLPEATSSAAEEDAPGVHLRLSEIEFADRSVMGWRSQLRILSARLARLQRELVQKQEEQTVAAAEAAWRSTWSDESV